MKHLFNITVYHTKEEINHACSMVDSKGSLVDSLEILTEYVPVDPRLSKYVTSVHLPYAADWFGPATGIRSVDPRTSREYIRYRYYGVDRKDIVETIRVALRCAEPLDPMYGVIHAGSGDMRELFSWAFTDSDEKVMSTFISILNEVVSEFPDGEPPFTLAFENTWWPGMRLLDDSLHDMLESELSFTDWGLCIDTGHLLVSTRRSTDEATALRILNECADRYSDDMYDRLFAMHLHFNATAHLMDSVLGPGRAPSSLDECFVNASRTISSIDQHRPFTDPSIRDYVERISPEFIVHEFISPSIPEQIRDHICQASLLVD